jgi:sugar phosphate isomerase/epimerase
MNKLVMAPTCLPMTPPLEYVAAAADGGFQAIGLRLHKSPVVPDWRSWLDDAALKRDVKRQIADRGLEVVDILSFYLEPEMNLDGMLPAFEYGAELGARFVLVIGDDPVWDRMVHNFGRLCDAAAGYGLTAAIECPVRRLWPLPVALQLIAEANRPNAGACIDPVNFLRAGDTASELSDAKPALFPYVQINDGPNHSRQTVHPPRGWRGPAGRHAGCSAA